MLTFVLRDADHQLRCNLQSKPDHFWLFFSLVFYSPDKIITRSPGRPNVYGSTYHCLLGVFGPSDVSGSFRYMRSCCLYYFGNNTAYLLSWSAGHFLPFHSQGNLSRHFPFTNLSVRYKNNNTCFSSLSRNWLLVMCKIDISVLGQLRSSRLNVCHPQKVRFESLLCQSLWW